MSVTPQVWDVYRLFAEQTNPPKYKFVIVTSAPAEVGYVLGIFINSELNEFQQQPELGPCFVTVPAATHSFLSYDSWAACSDVYTFSHAQLIQGERCGRITAQIAAQIKTAALACPILRRGHKRVFAEITLPEG